MSKSAFSGKSQTLSIYLLKSEFSEPEEMLSSEKSVSSVKFSSGEVQMTLFYQESNINSPRWKSLFNGISEVRSIDFKCASSCALLFLKLDDASFAITLGQGRHLLLPGSWNERFGLIVTLNTVNRNSLRSIDKKTFAAITRHVREQTQEEVSSGDFGIDAEHDLLRAVVGTPTDPFFGVRMTGMDALCLTRKICLEDLPALLRACYSKYFETGYKENYPWVDRITEISNPGIINFLDELLVNNIKSKNTDEEKLWLAVPEIVDWKKIKGFRFPGSGSGPQNVDLNLSELYKVFGNIENISIQKLKHLKAIAINAENDAEYESWSTYQCVCFETRTKDGTFLLSGGKWYRVASDFADEVNAECSRIPVCSTQLPDYVHTEEFEYNKCLANQSPDDYMCFDRDLCPTSGSKQGIEFCDLYSSLRQIIHIKHYYASKGLSHLFAQGLVSAEAFALDPIFRHSVDSRLPATQKFPDPEMRPRTEDFEIVFGVISLKRGPLELPFFSKVNLRHVYRRLVGFGYKVSLMTIANRVPTPYKEKRRPGALARISQSIK
jgi:uncharacterized protein (TIGR04141 family)